MSKQLNSILKSIPAATVTPPEQTHEDEPWSKITKEATDRVVAVIPRSLKEEIQSYLKNNKNETERTLLLKGLKKLGFAVKDHWLVDKRKNR